MCVVSNDMWPSQAHRRRHAAGEQPLCGELYVGLRVSSLTSASLRSEWRHIASRDGEFRNASEVGSTGRDRPRHSCSGLPQDVSTMSPSLATAGRYETCLPCREVAPTETYPVEDCQPSILPPHRRGPRYCIGKAA